MEIGPRNWVVLTTDGEFLHVPKQHHHAQPGDEVIIPDTCTNQVRRRGAVVAVVAAMIAGIFLLLPWMAPSEARADTYVYIDMNPSLELGINGQEVIQVRPLNQSARKLVQGIDWQRQNIRKVVLAILDRARKHGYIQGKEEIVLSGVSDRGSAKPLLEQIRKEIRHQPHLATSLNVYTLPLPKKLQDKAEGTGLSLGKYAVWLLAKREGDPITPGAVANESISQLMNQLKTVEPVLTDPPPEKQWEDWLEEPSLPAQRGNQVPQDPGDANVPSSQPNDTASPAATKPSPSNGKATDSSQSPAGENPSSGTKDSGQTTTPTNNGKSSPSDQNGSGTANEQGNKDKGGIDGGRDQGDTQTQPTNPPPDSGNHTEKGDGASPDQTGGVSSSSTDSQPGSDLGVAYFIPLS